MTVIGGNARVSSRERTYSAVNDSDCQRWHPSEKCQYAITFINSEIQTCSSGPQSTGRGMCQRQSAPDYHTTLNNIMIDYLTLKSTDLFSTISSPPLCIKCHAQHKNKRRLLKYWCLELMTFHLPILFKSL